MGVIDLYIRPETTEENSDILEINDSLSAFIEQIEMLFFTQPGEILGEPNFGIDLERYVHELVLNEYDLKQKINSQIKQYCPLAQNYPFKIGVFFAQNTSGLDAALINVTVENNTVLGVIV